MALRINNVPITSSKMFKEHFKLKDVFPLLKMIVNKEGNILFTSKEDLKVFELLKYTCKEGFSLPSFLVEGDRYVVNYDDESVILEALSTDFKIESVEQFQAVLLCQLGGAIVTCEELLSFANPQGGSGELKQGTVIILQNDERKELKLFPYSEELLTPIYTIAIHNQSTLSGSAHLLVCNEEGKTIDDVRLGNDSIIYANCTNGYLIELLPQFSVSCDHYNYFDYRKKPYTLCRKAVEKGDDIYVYSSDCSSKITQFTSDDERGVVGVKDGKLFFMSNIFNPMTDFQFMLENGEGIAKVEVKGKIYIVLTSKGRTFSNYKKMRLKNIVSVGISESCVPYAISSEGRLFIGSASECIALESNVYAVYSVDADNKSIKVRDGVIRLPQGQTLECLGKVLPYKECNYLLDSASGCLCSSKTPYPLAKKVLDFTLIKNGLNSTAGLVVYDGGNVEFISI